MSRFTEKMYHNARSVTTGMVTGEPHEPVRHTWGEVHERARCVAGGLAAAGIGHGDAVGVLAGFPVEIAPTAQGLWMRGASLTMLHQPTLRTDLVIWAEDTMTVIGMIEAKAVIISEPFTAAIPVLEEKGIKVLTVVDLLESDPIDPVDVGEDKMALMQLTSGSTGSPKAVQITHRNIYSNAEAMFIGAQYDVDKDVIGAFLPNVRSRFTLAASMRQASSSAGSKSSIVRKSFARTGVCTVMSVSSYQLPATSYQLGTVVRVDSYVVGAEIARPDCGLLIPPVPRSTSMSISFPDR